MKDVFVVMDDQGRKMDEEDIHPGAMLIGYQQGFEPYVFAVVDPEGDEVPESDADDAVDEYIAKEFDEEEAESFEEPTYMVRVTEDDLPDWPVAYIVEYTNTNSNDWSENGWGVFTCTVRDDAMDEVVSALKERFIEEVFSEEAKEKGDTPEKADDRAVYYMWTDWDAYSQEEVDEMEEAGEYPEHSTELVQINSVKRVDQAALDAYEEKHGEPVFEYDATE